MRTGALLNRIGLAAERTARANGFEIIRDLCGHDLAGEVTAVGSQVTRFQPGDLVFGATNGAFGEYACAPEEKLTVKPASVTFEQAAAVPVAALTALQGCATTGTSNPGNACW